MTRTAAFTTDSGRHPPRWVNLVLAAAVGFASGIGQGVAAPGSASLAIQPIETTSKPIITKSMKQQAVKDAAAAIRQATPDGGLKASATGLRSFALEPAAAPTDPMDETKVPHYFGPFPNWANSPFTTPDVDVAINGDGTGAKATASIGPGGVLTDITITDPGSDYSGASVTINGGGTGATANALVTTTGAVKSVTVVNGGGGYTAPQVSFTAVSGSGATATAYGGVDAVQLADGGSGYTNPTVDFDLPDGPDGVAATGYAVCDSRTGELEIGSCDPNGPGVITAVVVVTPGSGYSFPPGLAINNGTLFDPLPLGDGGVHATASATLTLQTVAMETYGSGYTKNPTVNITDPTGSGASATGLTDYGMVTAINLTNPGSGYITAGGMKKFVDSLPGLCDPSVAGDCAAKTNNLGQHIPLGVPDTTTFTVGNGFDADADYYEIALVQHRERMSSSLPIEGTLVREYVQLWTPALAAKHPGIPKIPLQTELLDGSSVALTMPNGTPAYGVDDPHYLGPVIAATKDRPVRVRFYNLLPTGQGGDLYIATDSSLMGAGFVPGSARELESSNTVTDEVRNPPCTESPKPDTCFADNRATLHLHGGLSPWISDGTPHQWITPAGEATSEPIGASVESVPDMVDSNAATLGVPDCSAANDGCQTFYYTNQQSARLMFYHDHSFGTTRLNVYLGEAAGYIISDPTEKKLISTATIPADQIPLIIQDRTFVPDATQLSEQDPTWDDSRWGTYGDFWYHHVYMPAQNPGDPSGMSAYGRWMFGPWFWPPATPPYGPIDNPYYNPACKLDDSATWTYQTDPFCEPQRIPGTPNISAGMEQFNDTPLVNGTAYPTVTVDPKSYRFRVLNAANDRFFNLSLYVADPTIESTELNADGELIGGTEVALNEAELAAAQLDPVIFPTPDTSVSKPGPSWIQIANEGGFLPAPAILPPQPTTWITDPTRFDVGNVDQHSLLVAPAERADVIVDFSKYRGKTLILYNDAPAAFPARVPSYDYYTGTPDMSPNGAPAILPGYGPNTRTVMQIKVSNGTAAPAFNLTKLRTAFSHKANGTGVFEDGQHPIIVGQSPYNSAYGTQFVSSGNCNAGGTRCDGLARISDQGGELFGFNTLKTKLTGKLQVLIEPKSIHDEMNSAAFDEFGRMSANMGLEVVPATPGLQNIVLYPYINPPTELIDGTKLPQNKVGVDITPIAIQDDGTQIWKITHNGVDTHPLHFHLYDVQLLNRVAWDNIISRPDANELGWKDTVRVNPLQDTIVALRPVVPEIPFDLPNSIRLLNPAMPAGSQIGFNSTDANGVGTDPVTNELVNFGWEYVWHCHILSHEEMDMMRPQSLALPPKAPYGVTAMANEDGDVTVGWNDASLSETAFVVQRKTTSATTWDVLETIPSPLNSANLAEVRTYVDNTAGPNPSNFVYRIVAQNQVGYGGAFMSLTPESVSAEATVTVPAPLASVSPSTLTFGDVDVTGVSAAQPVTLSNTGMAPLTITSITAPADFAQTNTCGGTLAAGADCTISVTFAPTVEGVLTGDLSIVSNDTINPTLTVGLSGTGIASPGPTPPTNVSVARVNSTTAYLYFTDASTDEKSFQPQVSSDGGNNWSSLGAAFTRSAAQTVATGAVLRPTVTVSVTTNVLYRVLAINTAGSKASAAVSLNNTVAPAAPSDVAVSCVDSGGTDTCTVSWTDNSNNNIGFQVQRSTSANFAGATSSSVGANTKNFSVGNLAKGLTLYFRVRAYGNALYSAFVSAAPSPITTP